MDNSNDIKFYVAVASTDKIVVNTHFGKAGSFLIYKVLEDNSFSFVEEIEVTPVCEGGEHDDGRLYESARRLKDYKYVIVSRIGPGAAEALAAEGIIAMEIPDMIDAAISKLIAYDEVQNLFN